MEFVAVIPARLDSSRLPGKVLADLGGRPMIEHVWRRVVATGLFTRVVVASTDEPVLAWARAVGADGVATEPARDGTHRVSLVARACPGSAVINVQGDLPFVPSDHLQGLVGALRGGAAVATLAAPLTGPVDDPARVKVLVGPPARFSRRPLGGTPLVHIGLYGFGPGWVERCAAAPRSERARQEDLEQLAWLDAGIEVSVIQVDRASPSVDTPDDLAQVRRALDP